MHSGMKGAALLCSALALQVRLVLTAPIRTNSLRQASVHSDVRRHNATTKVKVSCFAGTSNELCEELLRTVAEEKTDSASEDTRQVQVLPGEGAPPKWWGDDEMPGEMPNRLQEDCKEPNSPPDAAGGFGPEKIYCCRTAQRLVEDLQDRQAHCDSTPPVDCWDSLRKVLPNYIGYYSKRRDWLCRTSTTTTTSTSTTSTSTTNASVPAPAPEGVAPAPIAPAPVSPAPGFDWCVELCMQHGCQYLNCVNLCAEIHKRMIHRDECEEQVQEAAAEADGSSTAKLTVMSSGPAPAPTGYAKRNAASGPADVVANATAKVGELVPNVMPNGLTPNLVAAPVTKKVASPPPPAWFVAKPGARKVAPPPAPA